MSVWASEWSKDQCQLVDWLTFPGLSLLLMAHASRKETKLVLVKYLL